MSHEKNAEVGKLLIRDMLRHHGHNDPEGVRVDKLNPQQMTDLVDTVLQFAAVVPAALGANPAAVLHGYVNYLQSTYAEDGIVIEQIQPDNDNEEQPGAIGFMANRTIH